MADKTEVAAQEYEGRKIVIYKRGERYEWEICGTDDSINWLTMGFGAYDSINDAVAAAKQEINQHGSIT